MKSATYNKGGFSLDATFIWKVLQWLMVILLALLFVPWLIKFVRGRITADLTDQQEEEIKRRHAANNDPAWCRQMCINKGIDPIFYDEAVKISKALGFDYAWKWGSTYIPLSPQSWTENDDEVIAIAEKAYQSGDTPYGDAGYQAWPSIEWCYNEIVCPGRSLDADMIEYMPNDWLQNYHSSGSFAVPDGDGDINL